MYSKLTQSGFLVGVRVNLNTDNIQTVFTSETCE